MLSKDKVRQLRQSPTGVNRLARAMELAKVTQIQVAAGTGFTQSYVSRVKRGRYDRLPGETMRDFATYFGCQIEDLFPAPDSEAKAS